MYVKCKIEKGYFIVEYISQCKLTMKKLFLSHILYNNQNLADCLM